MISDRLFRTMIPLPAKAKWMIWQFFKYIFHFQNKIFWFLVIHLYRFHSSTRRHQKIVVLYKSKRFVSDRSIHTFCFVGGYQWASWICATVWRKSAWLAYKGVSEPRSCQNARSASLPPLKSSFPRCSWFPSWKLNASKKKEGKMLYYPTWISSEGRLSCPGVLSDWMQRQRNTIVYFFNAS